MIPAAVRKTAEDIRLLQVQGATAVAEAALRAVKAARTPEQLKESVRLLSQARPTEPLLRNSLRYVLIRVHEGASVDEAVGEFFKTHAAAVQKIIEFGSRRIESGKNVLTYCHSSLVTRILTHAHKTHGKKFRVFACETRPAFQGRITARELAAAGIPVVFITDNAVRTVVNEAQLVLVGADALTADGSLVNKVGTALVALAAQEARTPFAAACELLKFDAKTMSGFEEPLEERSPAEIWPRPPSRVRVQNRVFEETPAKYLSYLITEAGVIMPQNVLTEARTLYPWLFE